MNMATPALSSSHSDDSGGSLNGKSKQHALEMNFVNFVLAKMKKAKHSTYSWPFMEPVDPISMGIPAYFAVIKHPIDLSKIECKIKNEEVWNAEQFEVDVKLMFFNCYKFNPAENAVHHMGKRFEAVFEDLWAKKYQWISERFDSEAIPSSSITSTIAHHPAKSVSNSKDSTVTPRKVSWKGPELITE
jgi:bromodomain-containing factor 1